MNITYEIKKKQGNFRPEITIETSIEQWEELLNVKQQYVDVLCGECGGAGPIINIETGLDKYATTEISIPRKAKAPYSSIFYLPFRPGGNPEYPEVDKALEELRAKHEAAVLEAYNSIAFKKTGSIEPTEAFKKKIAPWVAKQKMIGSQDE